MTSSHRCGEKERRVWQREGGKGEGREGGKEGRDERGREGGREGGREQKMCT